MHPVESSLNSFSPLIAEWFGRRYGAPTPVQAAAWPAIASGKHVLLSAPTGSGKTLAAFLYALDRLLTGAWSTGGIRVLYVSPLKALNNDIHRNLLAPLEELREVWESAPGEIHVMTRSGDTPQADRERMRRRPPEILITTPESLNLLLSSPRSLETLEGIQSVILDEIHAVAGSKRGTHLITAVERLTRLSGEFQRIAISATVRPIERVADFVAGFQTSEVGGPRIPRPLETIDLGSRKPHAIAVRFIAPPDDEPGEAPPSPGGEPFWERLVPEIRSRVMANRSTIIFTTNRRHAEKLALRLNQDQEEIIAFAHHGSLSREVRLGVEERLKVRLLRLNAMDPISPCGRNIEGLGYDLPPRVPGTTLVYDGPVLLAAARRGGSEVSLRVQPSDGRLSEVVEVLKAPATRRIRRVTRLIVRRINGDEAARSSFARAFHEAGFVTDRHELVFWAKHQ